ncbi:MAG: energy transducer TonB [Gammaproteobacteria bacterium]|nr:energy transducer TonB [Gammaproteobacteria bacterium]MDH5592567.1 energy transducer TonB [Gammaproteobacteria bacterium]
MGKTTAIDRLIFTLLFSIIIHLVIVLGISFDATSPPSNQPLVNLEITLVKHQTELEPEQADFLAQANNEGGGETDEKSPEPTPDAPVPETKERATPTPQQPVVTNQIEAKPEPIKPAEKTPSKLAKVITQNKAKRKIETSANVADKTEVVPEITPHKKPQLSARDLMAQAQKEIARLEQQLDASTKALSKRPKKRHLSSRTKQYAAAAYHEAWRKKVERIGNLNYPQEAKRQRINGSLMLSVDINPDGSVPPDGIVISRSSGHKVLDDAAVRIVRLAAPYAAIPEDVLQGYDMITIIRTWKFETDRGLLSR